MLNLIASKLQKLTAALIVGAFALSIPTYTGAERIHDPKVETKAEMRYASSKSTTNVIKGQDTVKSLDKNIYDEENFPMNQVAHLEINLPQIHYFFVPRTNSASDTSIIGTPLASQSQCVKYLLNNNPHPNLSVSAEELVSYYYTEGTREGIRPDVAFAQALKETGFFRYGGTVTPDQNNYCGLGTTSATVKGEYFATPLLGVRAHIQHLLAYSSTRKPTTPLVDPRYNLVRKFYGKKTLGNWSDLNGRWAVPGKSYGQEILSMFKAILVQ